MLEVEVISWVTLNSQTLNNVRLPLALYSNKGTYCSGDKLECVLLRYGESKQHIHTLSPHH